MALTADEQAAAAVGFPMPEGNSLISSGDDAIRAAGVTAFKREWRRPPLTGATTLDQLTHPGHYPIPSNAIATQIGSPIPAAGGVIVEPAEFSGSGTIVRQTVWAYTTNDRPQRTLLTSGSWNSWDWGLRRPDIGSAIGSITRLSKWLSENPAVHTGGKGAVAFTFDHGLTNFKGKGIAADLSARGIRYGLALNSGTMGAAENSGATVDDVKSWTGAEIWNHGKTHSATSNPTTARAIVLDGKAELETMFGREVFGYIPAGVGPTGLAGFLGGATPEDWATTMVGQLILEHHAVTTGYLGAGGIRQLTGQVQQGLSRFTMDALTVARIKLQIDQAVTDRVGVMLMAHPSLLDTTGYLTTAQLLEVIAYAAQRQAAGDLAILSPGELVRADAGLALATAAAVPGLLYDSGPRNITSLLANGWTGTAYLARRGQDVTLHLEGIVPGSSTAVLTLPSGFIPRPFGAARHRGVVVTANSSTRRTNMGGGTGGTLSIFNYAPGEALYGTLRWTTLDPAPAVANLPGAVA